MHTCCRRAPDLSSGNSVFDLGSRLRERVGAIAGARGCDCIGNERHTSAGRLPDEPCRVVRQCTPSRITCGDVTGHERRARQPGLARRNGRIALKMCVTVFAPRADASAPLRRSHSMTAGHGHARSRNMSTSSNAPGSSGRSSRGSWFGCEQTLQQERDPDPAAGDRMFRAAPTK
jgi:hypothetical protein